MSSISSKVSEVLAFGEKILALSGTIVEEDDNNLAILSGGSVLHIDKQYITQRNNLEADKVELYLSKDTKLIQSIPVDFSAGQTIVNVNVFGRPNFGFGSTECSECSDCTECSECSDCTECSECAGSYFDLGRFANDCTECSECSDCTECSECAGSYQGRFRRSSGRNFRTIRYRRRWR